MDGHSPPSLYRRSRSLRSLALHVLRSTRDLIGCMCRDPRGILLAACVEIHSGSYWLHVSRSARDPIGCMCRDPLGILLAACVEIHAGILLAACVEIHAGILSAACLRNVSDTLRVSASDVSSGSMPSTRSFGTTMRTST